MRKYWLKRAVGVISALAMTSMSVMGVMAGTGDIIDTGRKGTLTIHKYDLTAAQSQGVNVDQFTADGEKDDAAEAALAKYALGGIEFTYLKVADINTYTNAGNVQLLYNLNDDLATLLGVPASNLEVIGADGTKQYTSDAINEALKNALIDNTTTKNSLEDYVNARGGVAMDETSDVGVSTATGLDLGLYLVVETRVPEEVHTTTDPFFVSLPMTDATGDYWNYDVVVYPKNQTNNPTINKLVKEPTENVFKDVVTASEGDILDFRLVTKLPKITSKATYLTKYEFVDTLSKGMTYDKDNVTVSIYDAKSDAENGTGTAVATWSARDAKFSTNFDDTANKMTVSMGSDGLKDINPAYTEKYLVVSYRASIHSDSTVLLGDKGNDNDVTLEYRRTNEDKWNIIKDKARVYTYGINLKKEFSVAGGDFTKVEFKLQNRSDGYYVTATGDAGKYYVTGDVNKTTEAEGTVFKPDATGALVINGLEADEYVLTEIHTSDGYSLLKAPINIKITSTEDTITASVATVTGVTNPNEDIIVTAGRRASATVDESATNMSADNASTNARVDMKVTNTKSFTLPQTGGLGTILFTLAGACVVICGVLIITKKGKKEVK